LVLITGRSAAAARLSRQLAEYSYAQKALAGPQCCSGNEIPFALDNKHAISLLHQVRVADQRIQKCSGECIEELPAFEESKISIVAMP
jgi:hypothetical protein